MGVVGAFHHGQQGQFHGHAALLDGLDDVEHVAAAAFDHASHVIGPVHVPLLVGQHQVVVQVRHAERRCGCVPTGCRGRR